MKRYLVTITDNIAPTSMPYNEFVLYRRKHEADEKQIVILLFKKSVNNNEVIPEDLELHCVGRDIKRLKRTVSTLAKQAEREQASVVFHIHEAKSVILFNLATNGKYCKQIIYTLHSTYKNYPIHNKVLSYIASQMCESVVCVSKTSYKYYPKMLKQKLGNRACYIQNGVDTERIDKVRRETNIATNEKFTFIYVARFVELKRHKLLFDIISYFPEIHLKLVGGGPLEQELRKDVEAKGIAGRVQFVGNIPRDKVYEELSKADGYISTSSYEGLPIGVLEAMRCELPCVLSDIEQHREIANNCKKLVLCDNLEDWKKEITKLIHMKKESLDQIGTQNAKDVEKYFSLKSMHDKYEKLYSQVI